MKIRMTVDMPPDGRRNGQPWPAKGEEADLPSAEAQHLCAAGVAEPAEEDNTGKKSSSGSGSRPRRSSAREDD